MNFNYQITDNLLNQISTLHGYLERFDYPMIQPYWRKQLERMALTKQAFGAVALSLQTTGAPDFTLDKDYLKDYFSPEQIKEFRNYYEVISGLLNGNFDDLELNPDTLDKLHKMIYGVPKSSTDFDYRKTTGLIPQVVWENNIKRVINLEVQTKPKEIKAKIDRFFKWFNLAQGTTSSVILAGITHYQIAVIHPYLDANGRLSKLAVRLVMLKSGFKEFFIISPEFRLYQNGVEYYKQLEKTATTENLTGWLEFYTNELLISALDSFDDMKMLSCGAVDLLRRKIVPLTTKEIEALEMLRQKRESSAAEIAREAKVSKQNMNVILHRLVTKGIIELNGKSTASRYRIKEN